MNTVVTVLVDVICEIGRVTKLEKHFRSKGFATTILTPDSVRAVYRFKLEEADDSVRYIISALNEATPLFKTICVEAWAILPVQNMVARTPVIEVGDGLIYVVRRGSRILAKVVWGRINPATWMLPGSALRNCLPGTEVYRLETELSRKISLLKYVSASVKTSPGNG
ncbi:hypothetical protein [Desulfurococcus amylolyticus]|uniref:Uncharacterized protein n=1 Tax=Desulfurococcus amylolyticus DSM 16532 TaxID=768672 RepID=I3XTC0_DESAM|nr:hypothetical protein [Desulfurococcus amylolyticus]AFL67194.1 hypothetical protein Desfe_1327 [Desulfurococcus amylolyticus DSM 16532]